MAGNFFLISRGPADSTTVILGDVVGHGLPAARLAAYVRTLLGTFTAFTGDPVRLLQLANTALSESSRELSAFVTDVLRWAAPGRPRRL